MEQRIRFESADGTMLAGELLRPAGVPRPPVVVFAHGWGSGRTSPRNRAIAEALVEGGIAALLFDFRGHGESGGRADDSTLEDQETDLETALDWVAARGDLGPIGVAGSSSGGTVALAVAARDARIEALVLRAPSADAQRALAARVQAPTLLVQGERDPLRARNVRLVEALHCDHRLLAVPGAGHLFDEAGTFDVALRETVSWFRQRLGGARENAGGVRHTPAARRDEPAPWPFRDRAEAGRLLAERLGNLRGSDPLVLALPRGGIEVGEPIALALGADLDVFVSRKIRAPDQPELAIGAVAEGDVVLWNRDVLDALGVGPDQRERQLALARRELEERVASYRRVAPRVSPAGRTLVVTDDGVATGATLRAALEALRKASPSRLLVALPGGASETLEEIRATPGVDDLVVLCVPRVFWAVGQLFERFDQVSSEEVCAALRRARRRRRERAAAAPI